MTIPTRLETRLSRVEEAVTPEGPEKIELVFKRPGDPAPKPVLGVRHLIVHFIDGDGQ